MGDGFEGRVYEAKPGRRTPVEREQAIGASIKNRRRAMGMTQETLGAAVGVAFQQIQKYESGVNKVPASRLFQIAQFLEVPADYFAPNGASRDVYGIAPGDVENDEDRVRLFRALRRIPKGDPFVRAICAALEAFVYTPPQK